jgi:hypothetical protein
MDIIQATEVMGNVGEFVGSTLWAEIDIQIPPRLTRRYEKIKE